MWGVREFLQSMKEPQWRGNGVQKKTYIYIDHFALFFVFGIILKVVRNSHTKIELGF